MAPVPKLEIERLSDREEARICARLMADSEPWLTLGRSYEVSLGLITDPTREVYVARLEGRPVGFVILVVSGAFVGYVQSIAVDPDWRGKGIGTRILAFAEERILQMSPNVFVCVSSFNPDALRLYRRLGYEIVGDLPDYIVRGHSEILMRKTTGPLAEFGEGGDA
jgi:ribosomal-protein-alanine N-acetyltransferase